jgi:hypothetical protein
MSNVTKPRPFPFAGFAVATSLVLLSQVYLLPKALATNDGLDFRLIWLSGQLWSEGISPYSTAFDSAYAATFGMGPNSHFWVYPPYWWILSRLLSSMAFESSLLIWNFMNYFMLIGAAGVFASLPPNRFERFTTYDRFAIALSILSVAQATPFAMALGQTSFLILAGTAALLKAMDSRSRFLIALGTALVMLKPNFGLFIVLFVATQRWTWGPIAVVTVAYLGISMWVVAQTGFDATLQDLIDNLAEYYASHLPASQPQNLTGIVHLTHLLGYALPNTIVYGLAAVVVLAISTRVRERHEALACAATFCAFMIPLHTYDMTLLPFLMMVISNGGNRLSAAIGFFATMAILRSDNLGATLGLASPGSMDAFAGSLLATIALVLGCISAILRILQSRRNKQVKL